MVPLARCLLQLILPLRNPLDRELDNVLCGFITRSASPDRLDGLESGMPLGLRRSNFAGRECERVAATKPSCSKVEKIKKACD
jgi:hypothetical protein